MSDSRNGSDEGGSVLRILLAENNLINRKLAEALLIKKGWKVHSVENGREVLAILKKERFDLVLMDVQMPEMDGFECSKVIRELEKTSGMHIPIVAMTAHCMQGDRQKCLDAGMDEYISKPMKADILYRMIESLTGSGADALTPQNTECLDLEAAMDAVDGDRALLKSLADDFLAAVPEQLNEIGRLIETENAEQLERRAHCLKGSVISFGAKTASQLAQELETMGRDATMYGAVQVLDKLRNEMELIQIFFQRTGWTPNQ